jgi:hypothetical protein
MAEGYNECNSELGRRLCAAYISYRMGIGVEYALKKYVSDTPGQFWLSLAKDLNARLVQSQVEVLGLDQLSDDEDPIQ